MDQEVVQGNNRVQVVVKGNDKDQEVVQGDDSDQVVLLVQVANVTCDHKVQEDRVLVQVLRYVSHKYVLLLRYIPGCKSFAQQPDSQSCI